MGDIVNLNRFRKRKSREAREEQAERNRARFGRTKPEKLTDRREAERRDRDLSGKKLDDPS